MRLISAVGWGGEMVSPAFSQCQKFTPTTLQEALTDTNNHPSCVPIFCQISTFKLCPGYLPAMCGYVTKARTSEAPKVQNMQNLWGRVSPACPRKQLHDHAVVWSLLKITTHSQHQSLLHSLASLFLYWWTGQLNCAPNVFCPQAAISPLPSALQAGEPLLPKRWGGYAQIMLLTTGAPPCFPTGAPPGLTLAMVLTSKLQTLCSAVYKKLVVLKLSPFFPVKWFWETVFLCILCVYFHTFFLSFFLSTSFCLTTCSVIRASLCSTPSSFLPQINSPQFLLSMGL